MMDRAIVTVLGIGRLRPAPGTWGSAAGLLLGYLLHRLGNFPAVALGTLAAMLIGFWAVGRYTSGMAVKDRSEIVIDEVAGQLIAFSAASCGFWMAGLPSDVVPWPGIVAPFLFFRLFDIWKPWIVGRADRRTDAVGVMLDDILAGVLAAAATIVAAGISHGLM